MFSVFSRTLRRLSLAALGLLVLISVTDCSVWTPKPESWSNATGAEQFERLWWQAAKAKDWNQVERKLAATYVAQSPNATEDRDQALARLKQLDISEFTLGEVAVHPEGDATVITYNLDLRGTLAGQPIALTGSHMMTVWQQQKRGWSAVAHSGDLP